MAVTVEDVAKSLGFTAVPADPEAMQRALDAAVAVIDPHIIVDDYQDHPVYEDAVLTLASDNWRQKDAPRGVSYGIADGSDFYGQGNLTRNTLPLLLPKLASAGLIAAAVIA